MYAIRSYDGRQLATVDAAAQIDGDLDAPLAEGGVQGFVAVEGPDPGSDRRGGRIGATGQPFPGAGEDLHRVARAGFPPDLLDGSRENPGMAAQQGTFAFGGKNKLGHGGTSGID